MGRKCKWTDTSARRYIRIEDEKSWELIRKIATLDRYKNSLNAIVNDALFFGLPELHKRLFEDAELEEEDPSVAMEQEYTETEFFFQLVRLMKEIIANQVIMKSMLCSLFNERLFQVKGTPMGAKMERGGFRDTPDYLAKQEAQLLKNAGR